VVEDEDSAGEYSEEISYKHQCPHCSHIVAEHSYSFTANSSKQTYDM
jgi:hypothetical protein